MDNIKKLPDVESGTMKVVWIMGPPVMTTVIREQLEKGKEWKIQTTVSLMLRLVERGFPRPEKHGKERYCYPLINREDYLKFETGSFLKQYRDSSLFNPVNTPYEDEALSDSDIGKLLIWAKGWRN